MDLMKVPLHLGRDVLVKQKEYPEIAFEKHHTIQTLPNHLT